MSIRFNELDTFGDSGANGVQDKATLNGVVGAQSLFNKFSLFRSHKVGGSTKDAYDSKKHQDNMLTGSTGKLSEDLLYAVGPEAVAKQNVTKRNDSELVNNPTARVIIDWSKEKNPLFGPTPYSITDFIYCKYYGKIPNNRLVTLRRFPMPVWDNMKANGATDMVPLAQAVTWFSEKTKNSLKSVIPYMSWDMPWTPLDAQDDQQNWVTQENVTAAELEELVRGIPGIGNKLGGADKLIRVLQMAGATVNGDDGLRRKLNGSGQQLADFNKALYESTGPKWNEIYGGVNNITQTLIRDKMSKSSNWASQESSITFHYSLKSYNGINPKIAMLDIISNFLALTYMNMQWKGSFARFIPTQGVTGDPGIDAQITRLMFDGKAAEGLRLAATTVAVQAAAGVEGLLALKLSNDQITKIMNGQDPGVVAQGKTGNGLTIDDLMTSITASSKSYASIAKKPFTMRAPLSGQPTGEWHLTVGNPLDPIATIGNLACTGCTMEFGDELGPNDFPADIIFTVKLKPAQPRDKYMIESMFNLGGGSLTEFFANPPSSASNTLGTAPDNMKARVTGDLSTPGADATRESLKTQMADNKGYQSAKQRLSLAYGQQYANLNMLPAYFMTDQTANSLNTTLYAQKNTKK